MRVIKQDFFNRANGELGADWDEYGAPYNGLQIVSNRVQAAAVGGSDSFESNSVALNNDQYAQITVASMVAAANGQAGAVVRAATPTTATLYYGSTSGGTGTFIVKYVAGAATTLASNATDGVAGDIMRLQVTGSALRLFRNGVSELTATDSAITSGRAGIQTWVPSIAALTDAESDDWLCGDFVNQLTLVGVGS